VEKELISWLEELNLTRREAEILALLLVRGKATVGEISEALNIARPHVYTTLKSLWMRGYVAKSERRPAFYTAEPSLEILREKIEEKARRNERMLKLIEGLASKASVPKGVVLVEGSSAFLTQLGQAIDRARIYLWIAAPRFSILGPSSERKIFNARNRNCDVRVATGDFAFFRKYPAAPSFVRYIEPPPPFILCVADGEAFFAPTFQDFVSWGLVIREDTIVRQYKAYFEHIWVEDYIRTLYKVRVRYPREEY